MWTGESGYFESDDVAKSCPVFYRTINQFGDTACKYLLPLSRARSLAHILKTFICRGALDPRVNPDTIGCVWTGEFDLNGLRVDEEIFKSGKKKLRIQKYPDTCGQGLSHLLYLPTQYVFRLQGNMSRVNG